MSVATVPRGTCAVCGGNYATAIGGFIRPHRPVPPLVDRMRGARTSAMPRCAGSRLLSVEAGVTRPPR